jgi:hypothetical protein
MYLVLGLSQAMLPDLKAQPLLSWEKLADVSFDLVWFEEHQSKFMVPRFGATPYSFKNKKVKLDDLLYILNYLFMSAYLTDIVFPISNFTTFFITIDTTDSTTYSVTHNTTIKSTN